MGRGEGQVSAGANKVVKKRWIANDVSASMKIEFDRGTKLSSNQLIFETE